jgi:hypothetical protein
MAGWQCAWVGRAWTVFLHCWSQSNKHFGLGIFTSQRFTHHVYLCIRIYTTCDLVSYRSMLEQICVLRKCILMSNGRKRRRIIRFLYSRLLHMGNLMLLVYKHRWNLPLYLDRPLVAGARGAHPLSWVTCIGTKYISLLVTCICAGQREPQGIVILCIRFGHMNNSLWTCCVPCHVNSVEE